MTRFIERYGALAKSTICETPEDLYSPASRRMVGDLCRAFLDGAFITPLELLHFPAHQTQLINRGGLVQHVVAEVAGLQAPATGRTVGARSTELHKLIDTVVAGTQALAESYKYPKLDPERFSEAVAGIDGSVKASRRDFHVYHLLSRHLADCRSWEDKLGRLERLFGGTRNAADFRYLDAILAEVLTSPAAWRGFLDTATTLCARLATIIDLVHPETPSDTVPTGAAQRIRTLLADHPTEETATAIKLVVHQALAGPAPLTPGPALRELSAARKLFDRLSAISTPQAVENLARMVEKRMQRTLDHDSLNLMLQNHPTVAGQLGLLIPLLETVIGAAPRKLVATRLETMVMDRRLGPNLSSGNDIMQILRAIGDIARQIGKLALPEKTKSRLLNQISDIQTRFIKNRGVFAHIEKNGRNSWVKLEILTGLMVQDAFTPGRNTDAARKLVLHYLGQPDLKPALVAEFDNPADREKRLKLMRRKLETIGLDVRVL